MIVCNLSELSEQALLNERMMKALEYLQQAQGLDLPDGRVEIDAERVYALVQSYDSKPKTDQPRFEAHRRYVDMQFIVSGKEHIGWAPLETLQAVTDYNEAKDVFHGTVESEGITFVKIGAGQLAVLYPADAHAPGLSIGVPAPVKKIVVKVLVG